MTCSTCGSNDSSSNTNVKLQPTQTVNINVGGTGKPIFFGKPKIIVKR
jgi:hypothetical protein